MILLKLVDSAIWCFNQVYSKSIGWAEVFQKHRRKTREMPTAEKGFSHYAVSLSHTRFSPSWGGLRNPSPLWNELPPPATDFLLLSVLESLREGRPIATKLRGGEAPLAIYTRDR